jgi:hypothetical protein
VGVSEAQAHCLPGLHVVETDAGVVVDSTQLDALQAGSGCVGGGGGEGSPGGGGGGKWGTITTQKAMMHTAGVEGATDTT